MSWALPSTRECQVAPWRWLFMGRAVSQVCSPVAAMMFSCFGVSFNMCIVGFFPAWLMCRVVHINRSHTECKLSSYWYLGLWREGINQSGETAGFGHRSVVPSLPALCLPAAWSWASRLTVSSAFLADHGKKKKCLLSMGIKWHLAWEMFIKHYSSY